MIKRIQNLTTILTFSLLVYGCAGQQPVDPIAEELARQSVEQIAEFPRGEIGLLVEVLDITDDQRAEMRSIFERHHQEIRETRSADRPAYGDRGGSFKGMRAKRQQERETLHEEILAVLTPSQKAKADELRAQMERGEVPEAIIDKQIEHLTAKLNLTDSQAEQIKALGFVPHGHVGRSTGENPRERAPQRKEAAKDHQEKLMSILTPEQQAILERSRGERKAGFQQRHMNSGRQFGRMRIDHLSELLGLTESQQEQLKEIFANETARIRESPADKSPEERRFQMQERRQQINARIRAILTEEQLAKYNEMRAERPDGRPHRFHRN